GLTLGLTLALVLTPPLIDWAQSFMGLEAWRFPFLLMSVPTAVVGLILVRALRSMRRPDERAGVAVRGLMRYSAVFLAAIMAVYLAATHVQLAPGWTGVILSDFAIALLAHIFVTKRDSIRPVLLNRNLVLI